MALEDQLLENFRQLPPEERQNLVAFARRLVNKREQFQADSMTEGKHQLLLEAIAEVAALSSQEGPPEDGSRRHDDYLYGSA